MKIMLNVTKPKEYCRPSPHSSESLLSSFCGDHLDLMAQADSPWGQDASLQSSLWAAPGQKGSHCHAETCPGISASEFLPLKPTPPPTRGASYRRQIVRCPPHSHSGWTGTPWSSHSPRSAVSLSCRQEHFWSPRQAFCKFSWILCDMLRYCLVHAE